MWSVVIGKMIIIRQVDLSTLKDFCQFRSVVDLGIRLRTNATNISPQEAVIGIHQCQQHDGKETLVVEVL